MTEFVLKGDTLKGLRDRKLGTHSIEKAAKLVSDSPVRNEIIVIRLMEIAIEEALKRLAKYKKYCKYLECQAMTNLPEGWMMRSFKAMVSQECQRVWSERKLKINRKKDHLGTKYKPKPNIDIIKGIKVGDEYMSMENEMSENPLVLGVEIDEDEAEFLKLPASFADLPKLDTERTKTDIQAMASKIRRKLWNSEGEKSRDAQGLDDEIRTGSVFDPVSNTLDFSKRRATDMKGCKRVFVPGPCEREAKLQVFYQ